MNIQASDTATTRIDKEADALSKAAGSSEQGAKLDTAAKKLGLTISHVQAFEGEPAVMNGVLVPSASAWAFGVPASERRATCSTTTTATSWRVSTPSVKAAMQNSRT